MIWVSASALLLSSQASLLPSRLSSRVSSPLPFPFPLSAPRLSLVDAAGARQRMPPNHAGSVEAEGRTHLADLGCIGRAGTACAPEAGRTGSLEAEGLGGSRCLRAIGKGLTFLQRELVGKGRLGLGLKDR